MLQKLTTIPLKTIIFSSKFSFGALQFSQTADKIVKENKMTDAQIKTIVGHGPRGLVMKSDVLEVLHNIPAEKRFHHGGSIHVAQPGGASAAAPKKAEPPKAPSVKDSNAPFIDIPLTNMRKVIAARLLEAKNTIPHFYLVEHLRMDEMMKLRKRIIDLSGAKISINDMFIKACAMAIKVCPDVNVQWNKDFVRKFTNADISVAVSTDAGLITPIIFDAGRKSLNEISKNMKDLADRAKAGKLKPAEFQGGTFCLSNLGMFNIEEFQAVINPPHACILAVGGVVAKFNVDKENKLSKVNMCTVCLSADHRMVDGAVGAKWLQEFKKLVEAPELLLL